MSEQYTFQAETQELLNILIHSLYTEKEIFLRELISNASDALNRLQFEMLTNDNVQDAQADLEIHIEVDEEKKTLTISDTGIGMNRDEIIDGLGTIAKSGAKAFLQAMEDKPDGGSAADIIGQFGVGFYSAFMVAKQVDVVSRSHRPEDEAVRWSATGGTNYTLETVDKEVRGTEITVHLKDDEEEFTRAFRIKDIIRRHSDYVSFPIFVGEDEEPTNKQQAIWRRNPSEVEDEEYDSFYKMLTMDFAGANHHIHMRADVPMQFYALLFVPSGAQPNMFNPRKEAGVNALRAQGADRRIQSRYSAGISGICAGRGRQRGSAAERQPGEHSGDAGDGELEEVDHAQGTFRAQTHGQERPRKLSQDIWGNSALISSRV